MKSSAPAKGEELHAFFEEVFRLHGVLAQGMDRVHEESGLRTPQRRLAETLEQEGQMTVPHAAAELEVSRQFVQTTCNDLASLGLVEFFDNPRHKRSRLVSLTKQGLAALARARREEARIIESALPSVDAQALRKATELLRQLQEGLRAALEV